MVDHWELWIMGSTDVVANTDISITVMHVRKPAALVTSNFKVGHTDKTEITTRTTILSEQSPQQLSDPTFISVRLCEAKQRYIHHGLQAFL
jgi:hypothetical protein